MNDTVKAIAFSCVLKTVRRKMTLPFWLEAFGKKRTNAWIVRLSDSIYPKDQRWAAPLNLLVMGLQMRTLDVPLIG